MKRVVQTMMLVLAGCGTTRGEESAHGPSASTEGGAMFDTGTGGSVSTGGSAGAGGSPIAPGMFDGGTPMGGTAGAEAGMEDAPESDTGAPPLPEPSCLDGITNYTENGPFTFATTRSGQVNFWVPDVPAGCKVPIVHFANGTGAACSSYSGVLEHLATHGFLTTCYESTNTGAGTQCLTAIQTALSEYPDLADNKAGATGHSTGGAGAILCVYRTEQALGSAIRIVGHAMEPEHGNSDAVTDYRSLYSQIRSPIFMFNGSADTLVSASWVRQGFDALDDSVEAYWYEAVDAPHIPVPARWGEESALVWFRWQLLGDREACRHFKNMPNSSDWNLQASQSETDC